MLKSGLVSVTFRQLQAQRVLELASEANLLGIEWGGDIHVPHGDESVATEVGRMTRDAGLEVAGYGSYYRLGECELQGLNFQSVLDAAVALGAPTIRVWAGSKGTDEATDNDWDRVIKDAQRVGGLAQQAGLRVCLEYHGQTLTDHGEAAVDLHNRIAQPNVDLLWQPLYNQSFDEQIAALRAILPVLSNTHVFHWLKTPDGKPDLHPLAEGTEPWGRFLEVLQRQEGQHYALIEFVRGGEPPQLLDDAAVLNDLLAQHASR